MRGWLKHAWGFVRGLPRDTGTYLHRIFSAIIGWATNIFHIVGAAWDELAKTYHDLSAHMVTFMDAIFTHIAKIVQHTIPDLARILTHDIVVVATDVTHLSKAAAKWVDDAVHKAESEVSGAVDWIRRHLIDPLARDVQTALDWIDRTGALVWHLINDGEYLAALVFKYLWSQVLALIHHYAATVLRWIIGNGQTFGVKVARIIEDAITEVL